MTLTEWIKEVLKQRDLLQEQLQERRALSRARMEAICENPGEDRVIIFQGPKRI